MKFNPENFNFVFGGHFDDGYPFFLTKPIPDCIIGCYELEDNDGWFVLIEICKKNDKDIRNIIYRGNIPTDEFAFQLFTNMELDLPVIQRELKINQII
jgi:hypothetical protein